jgi:hypothetical protein
MFSLVLENGLLKQLGTCQLCCGFQLYENDREQAGEELRLEGDLKLSGSVAAYMNIKLCF